jgi:hypothetical protein
MDEENQVKSLEDIVKIENFELKTTEPGTKKTLNDPIFSAPRAREFAFSLSEENPVANEVLSSGGKFYLLELASKTLPDEAEFEEKRAILLTDAKEKSRDRMYQALRSILRENARGEIKISESFRS